MSISTNPIPGPGETSAAHWSGERWPVRQRPLGDRTPTGAFLCAWLEARLSLRPSTLASHRAHIERHLIPTLGHIPMRDLRPETIQRAYHRMLAEGMPPATLARVHATLSVALNSAARQRLLSGNPLAEVELPRAEPPKPRMWNLAEARLFLAAVREDRLEILWRLALITGIRLGELLALRWTDLDLDSGTLTVHSSRVGVGSTTVEGAPKSRAGRRVLTIDPNSLCLLHHLRHEQANRSGYVFTDEAGKPLPPWRVSRRFDQLTARADLPVIRLHNLRHTSGSLGVQAGEGMELVAMRLSHFDIGIIANTCLQVPDRRAAGAAANHLARLLDTSLDEDGVRRAVPGGAP